MPRCSGRRCVFCTNTITKMPCDIRFENKTFGTIWTFMCLDVLVHVHVICVSFTCKHPFSTNFTTEWVHLEMNTVGVFLQSFRRNELGITKSTTQNYLWRNCLRRRNYPNHFILRSNPKVHIHWWYSLIALTIFQWGWWSRVRAVWLKTNGWRQHLTCFCQCMMAPNWTWKTQHWPSIIRLT